mgnify:FL=1
MIPFDFDYYKPDTLLEAIDLFQDLSEQGKMPMYYGGGTEIISMARANSIYTGAVIDIKGIPECCEFGFSGSNLVIGSAITLTKIVESNLFPMLGITIGRIADHTIQGKITLGGNLAGTVIYRESVLPLLISESQVVIAGNYGTRQAPISELFDGRMRREPGELIVKLIIDSTYTNLPFFHRKTTKIDKIDYPLVTVVAMKKDDRILAGFSGLCDHPFRSIEMEDSLNEKGLTREVRIKNAMSHIPAPVQEDIHGSGNYRRFVLNNILMDVLKM